MKILHSADWHLDSPIIGRTETQTSLLKGALLEVPHKIAAAAKAERCDMMLIAGDIFDGAATPESIKAVKNALEEAAMPVFIVPGNHDFLSPVSPWLTERWPENVRIFTAAHWESVAVPGLDCRVYGTAFTGAEADGLLEGFRVQQEERYAIGLLHGDPTVASSPYCPITVRQIRDSGLDYLALGHIHKGDRLVAGDTLCAWPGCPMGRGFDELDSKGVLIVTLDEKGCDARFLPLDTPRFFDLTCDVDGDAVVAASQLLPAAGNADFYRITFTGESEPLDIDFLEKTFSQFPNLTVRDRTELPMDIWANVGEDSLEGVYFDLLRQQLETADEETKEAILLAAKISRRILENREVKLP